MTNQATYIFLEISQREQSNIVASNACFVIKIMQMVTWNHDNERMLFSRF